MNTSTRIPLFFLLVFGLFDGMAFGSSPSMIEIQSIDLTEDRRGVLFDEWMRDRIRASSAEGRSRAAEVSDVTLFSTAATPFLDAALLLTLGRGSYLDALEISAVSAAALGLQWAAVEWIKDEVGRPRPYSRNCPDCGPGDAFRSFPSGHTSGAFTGASLTCLHHLRFKIYGSETLDAAACILGISGATVTGVLRMVSDAHYATDVLAGAALGVITGGLLPWLYYEIRGKDALAPSPRSTEHIVLPTYTDRGAGVSYWVRF